MDITPGLSAPKSLVSTYCVWDTVWESGINHTWSYPQGIHKVEGNEMDTE